MSRRLLLLLLVPQLPREHSSAKRAIIDAGELMALFAENQEILRVELGDAGPVVELIRLRVPRQVAVHQAVELFAAGHAVLSWLSSRAGPASYCTVHAPSIPWALDTTFRLMR